MYDLRFVSGLDFQPVDTPTVSQRRDFIRELLGIVSRSVSRAGQEGVPLSEHNTVKFTRRAVSLASFLRPARPRAIFENGVVRAISHAVHNCDAYGSAYWSSIRAGIESTFRMPASALGLPTCDEFLQVVRVERRRRWLRLAAIDIRAGYFASRRRNRASAAQLEVDRRSNLSWPSPPRGHIHALAFADERYRLDEPVSHLASHVETGFAPSTYGPRVRKRRRPVWAAAYGQVSDDLAQPGGASCGPSHSTDVPGHRGQPTPAAGVTRRAFSGCPRAASTSAL